MTDINSLGPLMVDIAGCSLTSEDKAVLQHPLVGGLIFFTRNFENKKQLCTLIKEIRALRPDILLAVDHEGGRVQRFREGFTLLPPMGDLGKLYEKNPTKALALARSYAETMATELLSVGIDFSFAPVLDLDKGFNEVIGDRAFHHDKHIVTALAKAFVTGMHSSGMKSVGKHFPGHGHVDLDSHVAMPIDSRSVSDIVEDDLCPFQALIQSGLSALMPAHIIFPKIDDKPVGFSRIWLHDILREQLEFTGVIISDDLSMMGAAIVGDMSDRVLLALEAGCDMVLVCQDRPSVLTLLESLSYESTDQRLVDMKFM